MSDVLGHEMCNAIHGLETVRAMAHALGEALPDEPGDKADPDKVRELTRRTLDTWREVRMLTTNGEAVEEPSTEQIDLEVLFYDHGTRRARASRDHRRISRGSSRHALLNPGPSAARPSPRHHRIGSARRAERRTPTNNDPPLTFAYQRPLRRVP